MSPIHHRIYDIITSLYDINQFNNRQNIVNIKKMRYGNKTTKRRNDL